MGQHHREVLAGATGRVQHPAVAREPGQEPLDECLVGGVDLAPLGVEVAGQGVLLSLVAPAEVPKPRSSIGRRGGVRLTMTHSRTNSFWRCPLLHVLHVRDDAAMSAPTAPLAGRMRLRWTFIACPLVRADGRPTRPWHGCGGTARRTR